MRNAYPIDEALQVAGETSFTTLVDNNRNISRLEDGIQKASEQMLDLKNVFDRNDTTIENLLSELYDTKLTY